ncbi:sulfatase [Algoriphagus namhaensis]|uniref:Sulfatase n=1 Tax=Algoriphagus namhaensis TaxID=915353 RepID=A0ABV8AU18_9BACT
MKANFTFLIICIAVSLLISCGSQEKKAPTKPNVLFILVDDLGYTDVGFMGSEFYETPNLDELASKSAIFTQGYAASAVCSPSRASIMTGRFVSGHGITDWIGAPEKEDWRRYNRHTRLLPPEYIHALPAELNTFPELFQQAGYKTFFAGKWHLGSEEDQSLPTAHGFDINVGGFHAGSPANGRYFAPFSNPQMEDYPEEKGLNLSMRLAQETSKFIQEHQSESFLAVMSFYAVHGPIQTTEEKWKKYRAKAEQKGIAETGFEMERILPYRKAQDNPVYAGLVEHMDDAVGLVLDKLKELDLMENTIIVFTSDNGGVVSGDNYSTNLAPLRGGKGYQWEGGTRVPYLIYVPWLDQKGERLDTPASGVDFLPTLLDLTGQNPVTENIDGVSLSKVLQGQSLETRALIWHYPHYGNQGGEPNSTIRKGKWKLIHYWEDGREELYDLENDLSEKKDLIASQSDIAKALSEELMKRLQEDQARYAYPDPEFSPDSSSMVLERFRTTLLERLENQRKQMLAPDFQPNVDWWGSKVID